MTPRRSGRAQEPWDGPSSGGGKGGWLRAMVPRAGMERQAGQSRGSGVRGRRPSNSARGKTSGNDEVEKEGQGVDGKEN